MNLFMLLKTNLQFVVNITIYRNRGIIKNIVILHYIYKSLSLLVRFPSGKELLIKITGEMVENVS